MKELEKEQKLPQHVYSNAKEMQNYVDTQKASLQKLRESSRQVSFCSSTDQQAIPQSPVQSLVDTLFGNTLVPVVKESKGKVNDILQYLQEPSTSTMEVFESLEQRISSYQTKIKQLEEQRTYSEMHGEDLEKQQMSYFISELEKLKDEATEIQ